jgi:hypothetical protein
MSLILLGEKLITSLNDTGKPAQLLNAVYTIVRDECLRDHHWNFAIEREALVLDSTAPAFGFASRFTLPPGCLKVIVAEPDYVDYVTEGGYLLTDEEAISIQYVKRVTDESLFDVKFVNFFATKLAAKISYNLTANAGREESLLKQSIMELAGAKAVDGQESSPAEIIADTWINSRA